MASYIHSVFLLFLTFGSGVLMENSNTDECRLNGLPMNGNTLLLTEPGEPYDILVEGVGCELKYLLVGGGGSGNSAGAGSGYLIYNNFVLVEDCTMVTALVGDQGQHSSLSFNKCGYQ